MLQPAWRKLGVGINRGDGRLYFTVDFSRYRTCWKLRLGALDHRVAAHHGVDVLGGLEALCVHVPDVLHAVARDERAALHAALVLPAPAVDSGGTLVGPVVAGADDELPERLALSSIE
jgi:hypothetical protein